MGWISDLISLVLIATVGAGIFYAIRLLQQLQQLRASRADMERFVAEFSSTVQRAEAGIKGLKQAARAGGDDLEKQIEKAQLLRDELHFLIESADQMASRISNEATSVARKILPEEPAPVTPIKQAVAEAPPVAASRAEQDLLKALGRAGGQS